LAPRRISASAGVAEVPGVQSTNRSAISDCGRIVQVALAWNGTKPALPIRSVTAARSCLVTLTALIVPTGAPAIRTCSPGTANAALSNSAVTW